MQPKNAFTLIELLAVISVIGILMGIVIPVIGEANRKAKTAQVKATIAKLELALSSYESDWSRFPPTDPSGNLNADGRIYTYLYLTRSLRGTEYMIIRSGEINSSNQLLDPWGSPYVINVYNSDVSYNPPNNPGMFDIYSLGPNRMTAANAGTDDDDINNWSRE